MRTLAAVLLVVALAPAIAEVAARRRTDSADGDHRGGSSGSTTSWLLTFNAGGSLRSEINLGARYAFAPWNPAAGTAIDLASDQCTLFLIRLSSRATDPPSTIARYNVCNRAFLPDFPARRTRVNGLRLLPDGGLLVSADFARHVTATPQTARSCGRTTSAVRWR